MEQINIGHGDPTIFRAFWQKYNLLDSIAKSIDLKSSYLYEYQECIGDRPDYNNLTTITHAFHNLFGTDCSTSSIIYGNGSTQVINAILYTISNRLNRPIIIGYKPPVYMLMHEYLSNSNWIEITFDLSRSDIDVEIVIDPNNPSGERRNSESSAKYVIYDRAYHWPIYTDISPTSNKSNEITVYTISKCLGMGGLRLGWAFINDKLLADEIQQAIFVIGICPNSFSLKVVQTIFTCFVNDNSLLQNYITELSQLLHNRRISLEQCSKFIVTNKSGPYAWIKSKDGGNIANILENKYNIKVYSGLKFGSSANYARLSLICSDDEFNQAISRLLISY